MMILCSNNFFQTSHNC